MLRYLRLKVLLRETWDEGRIILFIAFICRTISLFFHRNAQIIGDEITYLELAKHFVNGNYREYFRLPLWPYFISIFLTLGSSIFQIRIIITIISVLTCYLVFLLGNSVFGKKSGFIAGMLFALFPEQIYFSHLFYTEIFLEFFIVLGTTLLFIDRKNIQKEIIIYLVSFLWGIGLLHKHFIAIPFIALLGILFLNKIHSLKNISIALIFFLITPILYTLFLVPKKQSLMFFYLPLKNAREWAGSKPRGNFNTNEFQSQLETQLQSRAALTFPQYCETVKRTLYLCWGPNSYPILRILKSKNISIANWSFVYLSIAAHTLVIILGVGGLIFAPESIFKKYSFWTLFLFSGMCLHWFIVSRHRLPFWFILILYAAYSIDHLKLNFLTYQNTPILKIFSFAAFIFIVIHMYFSRLPLLNTWP